MSKTEERLLNGPGSTDERQTIQTGQLDRLATIEDAYYEVDLAGHFTVLNGAADTVLGYPHAELLGANYRKIMSEETAQNVYATFNQVFRTGIPAKGVGWEIIGQDGRLGFVEASISLVRDEEGQPVGFHGIVRDIRERKQAEDAIRASEERYRLLLDSSPDPVVLYDIEGKATYISPAFVQVFGWTVEELIGRRIDFVPEENWPETRWAIEQAQKMGRVGPLDTRRLTKEGRILDIQLTGAQFKDKEGKPEGNLVILRDVSKQKQVERALREGEERYRLLLESTEEGFYEVDLGGTFTFCNDSLCRIFGYPVEQLLGLNYRQTVDEANAKKVFDGYNTVFKTGKPVKDLEYELIRPNGERRTVRVSVTLIQDSEGRITGFRGLGRDVTEERVAELALQQAHNELEERVAERTAALLEANSNLQEQAAERQQAEEALRLSENRYRTLVEAFADIVFITDYESRVLYTNSAMKRQTGFSAEDFPTTDTTIGVVHADDRKHVGKFINTFIQSSDPVSGTIENRFLDKWGGMQWYSSNITKIEYEGQPALQYISRNITEQKQAEIALRQSEQRNRLILNSALDAVVSIDAEGNILDWNSQAETMFGWRYADVLGKRLSQTIIPLEHQEAHERGMKRFAQTRQGTVLNRRLELSALRRNGVEFPIEITIAPVTVGDSYTFTAFIRDITERKANETILQESVARRGQQVRLSTEIAQEIAASRELSDLYERVVTLVKEQFGYYHTQLLRYEPALNALVLVVGYGEVGEKMLAQRHQLPLGVGLIGAAAATGESVLRTNVHDDLDWQRNPLLPDTEGELAVPIKLGERVLGVLDVQSDIAGLLSAEDQLLLEGLCGQIAIAIENTRLQRNMEEQLRELSNLQRIMSQEGWQAFLQNRQQEGQGYIFDQAELLPVSMANNGYHALAETANGHAVATPLSVRGEIIGRLGIEADPDQPMAPEDEALLQSISVQVAEALESARLFEQTQIRAAEVEEARSFLDSVIENLPLMLFVKEAEDLRFVRWNKAGEELLGISRNQFLGKNDYDFFPKEEASFFAAKDKEVLNSRESLDIPEEPIHTTHHGVRILHTRKVPVYGSDGRPKYLLGISEDITEKKQAEEALVKRATELEAVAQVSSTTSTILEPDSLLDAVVNLTRDRFNLYHVSILLVNEAEKRLQVAAGSGEIGRQINAENITFPIDHPTSVMARAVRTRQPVVINDVSTIPDFFTHHLLTKTKSEMAIPMVVGDRVLGVLDVESDVVNRFTEDDVRVHTTLATQIGVALQNAYLFAEQLQTAEKLREVDRLKSEFLASMSHELRTPLNSIIGFADVLLEGIDGELTVRMEEDVRLIRESGRHLRELIGDILDMSRIEAGKMELRYEDIDMRLISNELLATAKTLTLDKELTLKLQLSDEVGVIRADRTRLMQILFNLISNAIKFTERGTVTLGVRIDNGNLVVDVIDTGIGIRQEDIPIVFEQFRQVDGSMTRKAGGSGLGLPISKKLVELHGGDMWVVSEPGKGSTFSFTIPKRPGKKPDTGPLPTPSTGPLRPLPN
jgi:PAS domain S-box-containing protein